MYEGPILVLDVSNLVWRNFYAPGESHEEEYGVLPLVLREVLFLQHKYDASRTVWAFDRGSSLRTLVYPAYKSTRKEKRKDPEKAEQYKEVGRQILKLRKEILPEIGFRNILSAKGYEADDVIASVCQQLAPFDEAVIVSTDKDLYQCVRGNVRVHRSFKEQITLQSFYQKYRIMPERWPDVMAATGCDGDDVKGIKGIGEVYALKWVRKELQKGSNAWNKIQGGKLLIEQNVDLVKLPYPGTPKFDLVDDEVTKKKWRRAMRKLGIESLERDYPLCAKE